MSFKLVGIGEVLWDLLPAGPQLGMATIDLQIRRSCSTCRSCPHGAYFWWAITSLIVIGFTGLSS